MEFKVSDVLLLRTALPEADIEALYYWQKAHGDKVAALQARIAELETQLSAWSEVGPDGQVSAMVKISGDVQHFELRPAVHVVARPGPNRERGGTDHGTDGSGSAQVETGETEA